MSTATTNTRLGRTGLLRSSIAVAKLDRISGSTQSRTSFRRLLRNCFRLSYVTIVLGLFGSTVLAETELDYFAMSLEELSKVKVTTASKAAIELGWASAPVEVITRDDILRFGYRRLSDALRRIIGLDMLDQVPYTFITIRGFATEGDINQRLLLMVDGHRTNDPTFNQALLGDEFLTIADMYDIERIEVVKGPNSAVWGTNAMLAVVNVITRKGATNNEGGELTADIGSHDRSKAYGAVRGVTESGLSYSLSSSYLDSDGPTHQNFATPSEEDLISAVPSEEYGYRAGANVEFEGLSLRSGYGLRFAEQATGPYAAFDDDGTGFEDSHAFADLSYERIIAPDNNGIITARAYGDRYKYDGDFIPPYELIDERLINHDRAIAKLWGAELRYSQDIGKKSSLLAGAQYEDTTKASLRNYDIEPASADYVSANEPFTLQSYYAELHYRVLEELELVTGARADIYNHSEDAVSPRISAVYRPFEDSTVRLMYGEGFRVASNSERNYADGITSLPNHDLEPEKVRTLELAWQQQVTESAEVKLNVFDYRFDDLIESDVNDEDLIIFLNNQEEVTSQGVELSYVLRSAEGLSAYSAMTYVESKREDVGFNGMAKVMAVAGISFPFFANKFFVSPELRYVGPMKARQEEAPETDDYVLTNLALRYREFNNRLELGAAIYNVFDTRFEYPAGEGANYREYPQEARTFLGTVTVRF